MDHRKTDEEKPSSESGFDRGCLAACILFVCVAALNIVLDPLFIYVFHWGVQGAAAASVLSQLLSASWVLRFLTGKRVLLRLKPSDMRPDPAILKKMLGLGIAGFTMAFTNSAVSFAYSFDVSLGTDFPYSGVFWNKPDRRVSDIDIELDGEVRTADITIKVDGTTVVNETNCSSHSEWTPR